MRSINEVVFDALLEQHETNMNTFKEKLSTIKLDDDIVYEIMLRAEVEDISFHEYLKRIINYYVL